ncbi:hypothetical protein Tco_1032782 [Tanacetum coccineum]|uniref:Retroviral polymerase SH3-like domain-containing protein n=1 Tax=Tanacetum coccineum TaxID=301880 RepID=A0ABQ5GE79_9ASTR
MIVLWYLDSGFARDFMNGDRARPITMYEKFIGTVRFGNVMEYASIVGYGQFCDGGLEVAFRPALMSNPENTICCSPTECYTLIVLSYTRFTGKTYYELLKGKKPNLQYFRVFGSLCYPTNDYDDVGKLKAKADIGIFVGYAPTMKALPILQQKNGAKIQETVHVAFDETYEGLMSVQTVQA